MTSSLSNRLARFEKLISSTKDEGFTGKPAPRVNPRVEGLVKANYSGGTVYCKRTMHPVEEPFGQYALEWAPASPAPETLPGFLGDAAGTKPINWAFVDCETTGLSGGAGTMAFLIAVGRPVKKGFQIKQFFMPEPADERGLLEAVEQSLSGVEVLWTYNGKCFDIPLLETRFRFWRMGFDPGEYAHVDLLVPTRVLFRDRIGDCSLSSLEERILKVARIEDLPGAEVPQVYFDYLQTGRSPRLHRVFEHNRVDVLSLAIYASHLLGVFGSGAEKKLNYPEDVLSLARYFFRRRDWEQTNRCLAEAKTFALGPVLSAEYHRLSGYLLKRCRDYEGANSHFHALADNPNADNIGALEETAKHHEHRRREFRQALKLTDRAIALVERSIAFDDCKAGPRELAALHHRRSRLRRKLARESSP